MWKHTIRATMPSSSWHEISCRHNHLKFVVVHISFDLFDIFTERFNAFSVLEAVLIVSIFVVVSKCDGAQTVENFAKFWPFFNVRLKLKNTLFCHSLMFLNSRDNFYKQMWNALYSRFPFSSTNCLRMLNKMKDEHDFNCSSCSVSFEARVDVENKFHSISTLLCNKALWLDAAIHMTLKPIRV